MITLLTEPEYQAAMKRVEALMNDESQKRGGELDTLVDQVVAYEAIDDAALALVAHSKVYTAMRNDPRVRAEYRKRAEIVVRAWLKAISTHEHGPKQDKRSEDV